MVQLYVANGNIYCIGQTEIFLMIAKTDLVSQTPLVSEWKLMRAPWEQLGNNSLFRDEEINVQEDLQLKQESVLPVQFSIS